MVDHRQTFKTVAEQGATKAAADDDQETGKVEIHADIARHEKTGQGDQQE